MNTPSSSQAEIERALVDVRRAYRLLHDYQRAALDAVNYLGAQLGLTYKGGWPKFSDCAPKGGKGSLDCWAWDWLNLVFYDFVFACTAAGEDFTLSVSLVSDTGYYLRRDPAAEKTDISAFAPAEASATKVGFLLHREWKDEYNRFKEDPEEFCRFFANDGELPEDLRAAGLVGRSADFSRLADEESADALITELVHWAAEHGYPLARIRKTV